MEALVLVQDNGAARAASGELCVMRTMTFRLPAACPLLIAALAVFVGGPAAAAQKTQDAPPTDSAAQSSPIQQTPKAPVTDSAAQSSPIPSSNGRGVSIAPHTEIDVKLGRNIDSGHLKNGDTVAATLAKPVALVPKGILNAGTAAELTVIETLPAGRIYAAGEFSLQVERVGSIPVYTDTLTYRGQPGHKDLPDSAPAVGTDAALAAGAALIFHVLPPPQPANGPPKARDGGPGSVDGVASGGLAPRGSSKQPSPNGSGKTGSGNQPATPSGTNSTQTIQPHP
jgi:hypothetical protein